MLDEQPSAEEVLYDFLANSPEEVIAAAIAIRRAGAAAAPESFELIGENYAVYDLFSLTGKMGQAFCHIVAYTGHVNLGLNRGAELADPGQLLEGTGKLIRHVRASDPTFVDREYIRHLIADAVTQGY